MKLLIQSDDYGMTRGISSGVIYGIEHGLIKNTGMFTNMPFIEEYVEWIKPFLNQICFGIDLNITTGAPVLSAEEIPTLVNSDGVFVSSWERRQLDINNGGTCSVSYEDIYKEFDAQIKKFIELIGKNPDYIHAHAYTSDLVMGIQRELSKKYGVIYSFDAWDYMSNEQKYSSRINWYIKPATLENQLASSLKDYVLENSEKILSKEYCIVVGHMGFVDRELMDISSYNIYRLNDLDAVTNREFINWVKDNNVELITYKDLMLK